MASQHKIIDLMNKGEVTMRSCGQKKDDLVTLLRGERANEVALFQSQGVNVRSRFQAVHVDDYVDAEGVDGLAGLDVKEIMTPDAGLQKRCLSRKTRSARGMWICSQIKVHSSKSANTHPAPFGFVPCSTHHCVTYFSPTYHPVVTHLSPIRHPPVTAFVNLSVTCHLIV